MEIPQEANPIVSAELQVAVAAHSTGCDGVSSVASSNDEISMLARKLLPKIRKVICQLRQQVNHELALEMAHVHESKRASAENMLALLVLRSQDRGKLVTQLQQLCLEFHSDSSVLHTLHTIERVLMNLCGEEKSSAMQPTPLLPRLKARQTVLKNREDIYGTMTKRYTSIMVTLDPNTIDTGKIARLIESGMDSGRINTAHDTPEQWAQTISNLAAAERASFSVPRKLLVHWDLGGPKLRTLPIVNAGSRVRRFRCIKDVRGRILETCLISFVKGDAASGGSVPVSASLFAVRIELADTLKITDTRGKVCNLYIVEVETNHFVAESLGTIYVETGTLVKLMRRGKELAQGTIGVLPLVDAHVSLKVGASVTLVPATEPGSIDEKCIPVDLAGAIVLIGHQVLLDDGQVSCTVTSVSPMDGRIVLRVDKCPDDFKLKPEKGINLPNSQFPKDVTALTEEDKTYLAWIANLMVKEGRPFTIGISFVRSAQDIRDVFQALTDLGIADKCSSCFKVETLSALEKLPSLLLASMWEHPVAFMLARGDLAGEIGFDRLPGAQDDVVVLANASHIPLIFATQVLETLSKNGTPSRAELSDVTQGAKAECIMLNKGAYLPQTVKFLDRVLRELQKRQHKHRVQLRTLSTIDLKYYKLVKLKKMKSKAVVGDDSRATAAAQSPLK